MTPSDESALCLFTQGARWFGLPIGAVEAVIEPESLVAIPLTPPEILGLCAYRRQVPPVVRLVEPSSQSDGPSVVILLRTEQGLWGIQADRDGIEVVAGLTVDPVPGPTATAPRAWGVVTAIHHDGRSIDLIDPEASWSAFRREIQNHNHGHDLGSNPPTRTQPR